MRRSSLYFLTFCAFFACAGLLVAGADAAKKHTGHKKHHKKKHVTKKPALQIVVKGCQQGHMARAAQSGVDDFDFLLAILFGGASGARASASQPAVGAAVTATLTGPYVTQGNATGTTDAKGEVHLILKFAGPGTYTVSITATKAGDTQATLTKTVNVSGPMNAACALA